MLRISNNVTMNMSYPRNPIINISMPICVVREEEYTYNTKLNPDEYLLETIDKSFKLYQDKYSMMFVITSDNKETLRQELSTLYRIKKKCIHYSEYRFVYNKIVYYRIGEVFFVMEDEYYYSWKAKYRDMKLQQILN